VSDRRRGQRHSVSHPTAVVVRWPATAVAGEGLIHDEAVYYR